MSPTDQLANLFRLATILPLLAYSHSYGHSSSILRLIERAAVWTAVRRVVDRIPFGVVVVGLVVVAGIAVVHQLSRRLRPRKASRRR